MNLEGLLISNSELFAEPQVACKLTHLLKTSPYNHEVVSVVQYDPALTARILQVCNTVVFRRRQSVSSLEDAVGRLGFKNILQIVWQISMGYRMFAPLPTYGMESGELWRHSINTAIAAEELRHLTSMVEEDSSTAFTAGLLHDFGKIMTNLASQPQPDAIQNFSKTQKLSMVDAEKALFGMNHAEFGGKLLERWKQPECLIMAVANHHTPTSPTATPLACLVHLADACVHTMGLAYGWSGISIPMVREAMDILKIQSAQLDQVMKTVQSRAAEVEVFMSTP